MRFKYKIVLDEKLCGNHNGKEEKEGREMIEQENSTRSSYLIRFVCSGQTKARMLCTGIEEEAKSHPLTCFS